MAKTPIDKLDTQIQKILQEYEGDVRENVGQITKEMCKKGAAAVKAGARSVVGGTGKYASGWTSEVKTTRYSTEGVIYNSALPGLAHLLENGHAKVNGGRVAGRPHIAPVEEKLVKEYEEEVINAITSD